MAKVLENTFTYEGTLNINPEILIDWFDDLGTNNPYSWLSNFYEGASFSYRGVEWATAEHAYQAMKVFGVDDEIFNEIANSTNPQEAKTLGRTAPRIRPDWEEIKFQIMREVIQEKFMTNIDLLSKLIATKNAYLQEGTFWNDKVWGVELTDQSGKLVTDPLLRQGNNWLGTALMELRSRLSMLMAYYDLEDNK